MNIYIVEDDLFHLEDIKITLEELKHNFAGHSDDALEVLENLEVLNVDVVLMDIHLHGKEVGIKLARRIKSQYQLPIIFTSSDRNETIIKEAADIEPVAYLTKPINAGDLQAALILTEKRAQVNNSSKKNQQDLYVKHGNKLVKISTNDILYAHTDTKNYCTLVTASQKKLTFRNSILGFYKLVNPTEFVQTHRSYIVNIKHIDSFHESDQTLEVKGYHIPIGRTFKAALYKRIQIL